MTMCLHRDFGRALEQIEADRIGALRVIIAVNLQQSMPNEVEEQVLLVVVGFGTHRALMQHVFDS
jgi:hypothetical protein